VNKAVSCTRGGIRASGNRGVIRKRLSSIVIFRLQKKGRAWDQGRGVIEKTRNGLTGELCQGASGRVWQVRPGDTKKKEGKIEGRNRQGKNLK